MTWNWAIITILIALDGEREQLKLGEWEARSADEKLFENISRLTAALQ